ncbi:MAG: Gfo/Idh/MocA family protein [Clostridia bacterium]
MQPLRIAVCGLGWWGQVIVPLAKGSAKLQVTRVVDPDPQAAGFAREQGVRLETRYESVLDDAQVDAVVLCTPHTLHAEQIVQAARARKHVFCEKPLCLDRASVLRAVQACNDNGVALAVGHEKRFEPPIEELLRLVHTGALGTPLQVEANFVQDKFLALPADNWRLSPKEAPAGPMTATGIHLLDLAIGAMGPAARVFASARQLASQLTNGDTIAVLVCHESGAHSLLNACLATPFDGRFAVYGSHGWAEVRDNNHPEQPQGWILTRKLRGKERETVAYEPAKAVLKNLEAFADAAAGRAPYPVPQEQMVANVSALEAVFRSAQSGIVERVDNG